MSTRIKFDTRGPSRVVNNIYDGLLIERGVQVLDFPVVDITGGAADPQVLLRCLSMVGSGVGDYVNRFPHLYDQYPPPNSGSGDGDYTFCTVINQDIKGYDRVKHIVDATIRYHSPIGPQSSAVITYTVNDNTQQSMIKTWRSADGSQTLSSWYQPGYSNSFNWTAPDNPNVAGQAQRAAQYSAPAQQVLCYRVITAIGQTTSNIWNALKAPYHAARGVINSDTTGAWAPRGKWLYAGPQVQYSNAGVVGTVTHTIIEGMAVNGVGRWFPILPFFDHHNEHPADSATEIDLTTATGSPGYPPPVGDQIRINGLTMASVYQETDFATLFHDNPEISP